MAPSTSVTLVDGLQVSRVMNPMPSRQGLVSVLHLNSTPVTRNRFNFTVRHIRGSMTSYPFFLTMANHLRERSVVFANALFYLAWQCKNQIPALAGNARAVSPCGRVPVSTTPVAIQQGALAHFYCSIDSRLRRHCLGDE